MRQNNKEKCGPYFSMDCTDYICTCVYRALQNLIWIIPWKLHALQRSEELCNRRSNRNSAAQHVHKFIFYRRMHYASFRHILAAVFALLHLARIKMNRRVLLCNVFLIVRVTGRFCKRQRYSSTLRPVVLLFFFFPPFHCISAPNLRNFIYRSAGFATTASFGTLHHWQKYHYSLFTRSFL